MNTTVLHIGTMQVLHTAPSLKAAKAWAFENGYQSEGLDDDGTVLHVVEELWLPTYHIVREGSGETVCKIMADNWEKIEDAAEVLGLTVVSRLMHHDGRRVLLVEGER